MRILLLGANGQVGWELQRALAPLGQLQVCGRQEVDLKQLEALRSKIRDFSPTIIVNAAAYTAVDRAETDIEEATRINVDAVAQIATETKRLNAFLIHYSTDYIFDGQKKSPYVETDSANPLSVYGKTKWLGEEAIRASACRHFIFRASWVYATRGSNFAKTMLRLARERDELNVVGDQWGVPTSAELIADMTALSLYRLSQDASNVEKLSGTYHLTPTGETTWYSFAKHVITMAERQDFSLRIKPENLHSITSDQYPTAAKRPANSRLSTHKITQKFGVSLPAWETQVNRLILELNRGGNL